MIVSATYKNAHISAQKCRLVARQVNSLSVDSALDQLKFSQKKAANLVYETLSSAIANAENNFGCDLDDLVIKTIYVNEAPTFKRFRARAKGRGARILKRNCHITVTVSDEKLDEKSDKKND